MSGKREGKKEDDVASPLNISVNVFNKFVNKDDFIQMITFRIVAFP